MSYSLWDSNPHAEAQVPKTCVYSNSTKGAYSGLTVGEACRLLNRDPVRVPCYPAFCTC